MYKEVFLGIFSIREPDLKASMPIQHDCGLWQAWEMEDGDYIVQPVDERYTPLGDAYLLDRMDFISLLAPVAVTAQKDVSLPRPGLDAASPNLLEYWYGQEAAGANAGNPAAGNQPSAGGDQANAEAVELYNTLPAAAVAADERVFSPVWHPDEALPETAGNTPPLYPVDKFPKSEHSTAQRSKQFFSSLFGKKNPPAPGGDAESREKPPATTNLNPAAANTPDPREQPSAEPAQTPPVTADGLPDLEEALRREFALLIELAGEGQQPDLEQRFAALIASEAPFTEEQKFLFSEFGLALRRKRKNALALAAHKRALELAPDDENILFNVARAEYELGNTGQARACLEKAIMLVPAFSSAVTFLTFLNGTSDEGEKHP